MRERDEVLNSDLYDEHSLNAISPVIGRSNRTETLQIFNNCHQNLKEKVIGKWNGNKSEFLLSKKKLDIEKIRKKIQIL